MKRDQQERKKHIDEDDKMFLSLFNQSRREHRQNIPRDHLLNSRPAQGAYSQVKDFGVAMKIGSSSGAPLNIIDMTGGESS